MISVIMWHIMNKISYRMVLYQHEIIKIIHDNLNTSFTWPLSICFFNNYFIYRSITHKIIAFYNTKFFHIHTISALYFLFLFLFILKYNSNTFIGSPTFTFLLF